MGTRAFVPFLLAILVAGLAGQDGASAPGVYKGRRIATTMHYLGAPWLTRESREREEECSRLLRILDVEAGDVVCDLGCGNGFYTLPLAERVGPRGAVLAVDIQPEMLEFLADRAEAAGVAGRVRPILGTLTDPKLPEGAVDLILLVDVYHELSHPQPMLAAMRRSLAPDGQLVLVEFRAEDPDVPIKPLHKMSKRQMLIELPPNGFRLAAQFDGLPWQHVMFFERAPDGALARAAREALLGAAAREDAALPASLRTRIFMATGEASLLGGAATDFALPPGLSEPAPEPAAVRRAIEAIGREPVASVRLLCEYLERADPVTEPAAAPAGTPTPES
jgi:SAM-dependent methyltransferase